MLSQALLFLVAGYETTATALEFITYNLAMHPNVQEELIKEIDRVLDVHVEFMFLSSTMVKIKL